MGKGRFEPWALAAITMAGMALRFWRLDGLALVGDESYFWLWSQHLAPCYLDHPGGVAWLIALSTLLGGTSEFGVRWLNAALGTVSIVLTYGLARRLTARTPEDNQAASSPRMAAPAPSHQATAALAAASIIAFAPPYVLIARVVYTNALPVFLLLASLNLLWPVLAGPPGRQLSRGRWTAVGLTWLLLLNTKFNVYPAFIGLAAGSLLWRRDLWRLGGVWLAVGLGALGLLPLLWWNATHDWIGVLWDWQQFTQGTVLASGPLSVVRHVLAYITVPSLLLIAAAYVPWWRAPLSARARWLVLPSLLMIVPVLLSPANSPRNLLEGLALVIPLAGLWWVGGALWVAPAAWVDRLTRHRRQIFLAFTLAAALYGTGTTAALLGETRLPHSPSAAAARADAAGWRELGGQLSGTPGLLYTVDYSTAAQLTYYAGRPAYTSWPQYLLWGLPDFQEATVLSQVYADPGRVEAALRSAFAEVKGPQVLTLREHGSAKTLRIWQGRHLMVDKGEFARRLDFFTLTDPEPR